MKATDLSYEEKKALLGVKSGADITSYNLAGIFRAIQKKHPEYLDITKPMARVYRVDERHPYFGVIATEAGLAAANKPGSLDAIVGKCFLFIRDKHEWNGVEVAVLSYRGGRIKIARSKDVCEGILAPKGSKQRKLKTWTCTEEELL